MYQQSRLRPRRRGAFKGPAVNILYDIGTITTRDPKKHGKILVQVELTNYLEKKNLLCICPTSISPPILFFAVLKVRYLSPLQAKNCTVTQLGQKRTYQLHSTLAAVTDVDRYWWIKTEKNDSS